MPATNGRDAMRTRSRLALGTFAAATVLVTLGATDAYAHSDGPELCITGSCAWFHNDGDSVYVEDTAADGHSAVAQVEDASAGIYDYLWNANGNGSVYSYSYGTAIPEGDVVYYRPCIGENATKTILSCNSGWTHGIA